MPTETPPASDPHPAPPTFWTELRRGIAGEHRDYTSGSIARAVVLLAVPMVLEMLMQSVFAVVDIFFVGKLGPDAVAAVGMTDSLLTLVFAVALGLSMGAAAMVARRIGEGKQQEAATVAAQAIGLGTVLSLVFALPGVIFARHLLGLMGATPEVVATGSGFTAIMLGSNITVMLLFLINAIFRGAGDASIAMRVLWLANLINIALDPLLIFGWGPFPALGLEGAAWATVLGRGLGVVYQVRELVRGRGRIALRRPQLHPDLAVAGRLLRVSGVGMLQFLIGTASWLGILRILATFGSAALAGYTIAVRVIIFILLPSWGMGNAAATLVGQNLGAGKPERAARSVWVTAGFNMCFMAVVTVIFLTWTEPIIRLFTGDAAVVAVGVSCLRIVSYTYVFLAIGMVTIQAFNGAGDTTTPTWINFGCYWLLQIPSAWVVSTSLGYGPRGVFITIAVTQICLALVGATLFRRGKWKLRSI